ncbi:MAG: type IV pilus assembly protein PilW [Candidatus Azotimanducaceae bacterium]|jgi:type IV pilus assembly protein PilW
MKRRHKRSVKGFSLVELMIALALGSVVTAGVVQLFVANSETHTLLIGQSRMQESARFALDFVGRQVRQAGYRGCFSGNANLLTSMGPNNAPFIPYEFDLRLGIQGFNDAGIDTWNPPLDVLPNTDADFAMTNPLNTVFKTTYNYGANAGIDLDEVVSGTDVVTFRHISQIDARLGGYTDADGNTTYGTMPTSTEPMVVGVQAGWAEFDLDHLAMVHDCEKATVFRVTTSNPWGRNGDGSPMAVPTARDLTVGHDTGDPDTTQNIFTRLALLNTFGVDAAVSAIESHTFFIAPGEGVNNAGNRPLSLWRKSGVQAPIELIEGVEDLQLLYGIDTDTDGVPNQYFSANFVPANGWTNVATVRVSIVVNSIEDVGSTTSLPTHGCTIQDCITGEAYDGLIRRSFTQTIMMRNSG